MSSIYEPITQYFKVSHQVLESQKFKQLSPSAKILYIYLCKYRNRYQGNNSYFTRSDRQINLDSGLSRATISRAKKELFNKLFIDYDYIQGTYTQYDIS